VIINGRFVMKHGAIPGVDPLADTSRAQAQFDRIIAQYPRRTFGHPPVNEIFSAAYPAMSRAT